MRQPCQSLRRLSRQVRGLRRTAGATVIAVLLLLDSAGPAAAHDHLTQMTPAVGSSNGQLPASVMLMFDDAVASVGASLVVVAPSGATISQPKPTVSGSMISVPIKAGAVSENGSYAVRFRIISVDGHEVHGSEAFSVGVGGPVAPAAVDVSNGGGDRHLAVGAVVLLLAGGLAVVVRRARRADDLIEDEEI